MLLLRPVNVVVLECQTSEGGCPFCAFGFRQHHLQNLKGLAVNVLIKVSMKAMADLWQLRSRMPREA